MTNENLALYDTYVRGADPNDRRRFDSFLLAHLLAAVDEDTMRSALAAAAVDTDRARS